MPTDTGPAYRDPEAESEDSDPAFADAIMEAFPAEDWDENRIAAMKEAIKLCVEKDRAGGYDAPKKPKGGVDLVLAFGGPGKGKK